MEKKKITNDENISNLKKRKILRYLIITFSLITMGLAIADLFLQHTILLILAITCLVITTALNKYRDSLTIIKKDELQEIREAIAENDKKFKKGTIIEDPMDEKPKEKKKVEVKKTAPKKTRAKKTTTTAKKKASTTKKKTTTTAKKTTAAKKSTTTKSTAAKKKTSTAKKTTSKKTTSTKKSTTTKKNNSRTKKTVDKA